MSVGTIMVAVYVVSMPFVYWVSLKKSKDSAEMWRVFLSGAGLVTGVSVPFFLVWYVMETGSVPGTGG